jgi:hypothetical protein
MLLSRAGDTEARSARAAVTAVHTQIVAPPNTDKYTRPFTHPRAGRARARRYVCDMRYGRCGVRWVYVRWVGVWARAWKGRAAPGAEWDGMKCKERGAEREWDGRLWDHGPILTPACRWLNRPIIPILLVAAGLAAVKSNWAGRSYPERNPNRHDQRA